MIEKGGGRNAKANESTFCIFAKTAFPRLPVFRMQKSLKGKNKKERARERETGNKLENLRLLLQVPSVSVEMETLWEKWEERFYQMNLPSSKRTFKVGLKWGHRIKVAFKGKFMLCNIMRLTV